MREGFSLNFPQTISEVQDDWERQHGGYGKVGGFVYELDLTSLRRTLVKGVRMVVAIRRLAKDVGLDRLELATLEREVREGAGALQEAESCLEKGECCTLKRS